MEKCILCQIVKGRLPSKKIYEDNEIIAVLDFNGASAGHTFVMPKEHFTIFEQVPSDIITKTFIAANKVSKTMFETLNIQGTNIFVSNGVVAGQMVAHFMVNVIPRKEGDGINLQWKPKQLTEEEISTVELQLKNNILNVESSEEKKASKPRVYSQPQPAEISGEDNYLLKQIMRIP